MPRKAKPKYVFATVDTAIIKGGRYRLRRGDAWYADHPIVAAFPDSFSDEPPVIHPNGWEPPVEQATAAPGEKRTNTRAD